MISANTIIQASGDGISVIDANTRNVSVRNNIIRVANGYAINVDATAGENFSSDYNIIDITGSGKIGRWENKDFTTPTDWFYEVGLDQHSTFGDPSLSIWTVQITCWVSAAERG